MSPGPLEHTCSDLNSLSVPSVVTTLALTLVYINPMAINNEEALRPIRLLESRNQESGIVLKTLLNSCFASQETCFPPLKSRSSE